MKKAIADEWSGKSYHQLVQWREGEGESQTLGIIITSTKMALESWKPSPMQGQFFF